MSLRRPSLRGKNLVLIKNSVEVQTQGKEEQRDWNPMKVGGRIGLDMDTDYIVNL